MEHELQNYRWFPSLQSDMGAVVTIGKVQYSSILMRLLLKKDNHDQYFGLTKK